MEFTAYLGWVTLLVGFPLNAIAALLLRRTAHRAPHLRVLRERYLVSVVVMFVVLFFGLIFVNNDQVVPPLDLDTTKWITRSAILAMALATSLGWIWLYRTTGKPGKE